MKIKVDHFITHQFDKVFEGEGWRGNQESARGAPQGGVPPRRRHALRPERGRDRAMRGHSRRVAGILGSLKLFNYLYYYSIILQLTS